uniref:Uncharacterized protein n=1 Tax=Pavo cristatus TaxID=9049 RepID=A0A8C9FHE3_PAVCR
QRNTGLLKTSLATTGLALSDLPGVLWGSAGRKASFLSLLPPPHTHLQRGVAKPCEHAELTRVCQGSGCLRVVTLSPTSAGGRLGTAQPQRCAA